MKVVLLNGSPRVHGNTALALSEMEKIFAAEGVEAEEIAVGSKAVRGCMACGGCAKTGKCVYDDVVNEIAPKFEEADGLVVATPVYYASANATVIAVLDRLFMSTHFDKRMKVGGAIAVARRAGTVATLDGSTSTSRSPACQSPRAATGPTSSARRGERLLRMRKAWQLPETSRATWSSS